MDKRAAMRLWAENIRAIGVEATMLERPKAAFIAALKGKKAVGRGAAGRETVLKEDAEVVAKCRKCLLGGLRAHSVYGDGNVMAEIVFVGEAPGAEEDRQGLPFVGRAGVLLNKLLEQVGLMRSEVYICNVIKCRPPENRDPLPEEISACKPYLDKQLSVIKPRVICCLGLHAAQTILNKKDAMTRLRSASHVLSDGTTVVPTYHTAAALRFPAYKQQIYDDLIRARDIAYGL